MIILNQNCHPYLFDMFSLNEDGMLTNEVTNRTNFGKKRFSSYAKGVYNNFLTNILD